MRLKTNLGADAAILLTTLVWGSTFAVARDILDRWPPLAYLALRLPLAALLFAALFPRQVFGASRAAWRARPSRENLAGVVLASVGGALILAPAGAGLVNTGDLVTLGTTLLFAAHVSLMSVYARRFDVRQLSALQVVVAAALTLAAWL